MLFDHQGKVFLYNNNKLTTNAFNDFFDSRSLHMFGSDNLYQMILYAKEISPDLMIFNLQDHNGFSPVHYFTEEVTQTDYPIIVLRTDNLAFDTHPDIAHYIRLPHEIPKLTDIIESYGLGMKNHQILIISSYQENKSSFLKHIEANGYTYFETHNVKAAKIYLQKNTPDIICIENTEKFKSYHNIPFHNKIFYVDRDKDNAEIRKFLN